MLGEVLQWTNAPCPNALAQLLQYHLCIAQQVPEAELARRRAAWKPKEMIYPRGYGQMFAKHVTQADKGCDFDFLEGDAPIPEPEIH